MPPAPQNAGAIYKHKPPAGSASINHHHPLPLVNTERASVCHPYATETGYTRTKPEPQAASGGRASRHRTDRVPCACLRVCVGVRVTATVSCSGSRSVVCRSAQQRSVPRGARRARWSAAQSAGRPSAVRRRQCSVTGHASAEQSGGGMTSLE